MQALLVDGSFEPACVTLTCFAPRFLRVYRWILTMIVPLGGERKERSHEINYPSLGLHAILDMRDTSSTGWTHSLDKMEGTTQNKLPQFRVLQGSRLVDWLKMASTS